MTTTSFQSRPLNGNLFLLRIIHGFVTEPYYICHLNLLCIFAGAVIIFVLLHPPAPPDFGGCTSFAPPLHPLCTPFAPPTTGAAPLGFGGAPLLHPPAPSQVLDFGILPMYLSFQVHLWSSVLWMLEEYYGISTTAGGGVLGRLRSSTLSPSSSTPRRSRGVLELGRGVLELKLHEVPTTDSSQVR